MVAVLWHSCRRGAVLLRLTWGHICAQGRNQLLSELWLTNLDPGLPFAILLPADVLKNAERHSLLTYWCQLRLGQEKRIVQLRTYLNCLLPSALWASLCPVRYSVATGPFSLLALFLFPPDLLVISGLS